MSNPHPWTKNDRKVIKITKLEDDIEKVTGIDNPSSIMNNKTNTCERTLSGELYEVLF